MRYLVTVGSKDYEVDLSEAGPGRYRVRLTGGPLPARTVDVTDVLRRGGKLSALCEGRVLDLLVAGSVPELQVRAAGYPATARVESIQHRQITRKQTGPRGSGPWKLEAPMPGRVISVAIQEGQILQAGAALVVIEAMKMQNEIIAERACRVVRVLVKPGDAVESGAPLLELT